MQAYHKSDLYNKYVQQQALEALQAGCISVESFNRILLKYPNKLYTPNYFIRIALALLTIVCVLFFAFLLFLLFSPKEVMGLKALLALMSGICYITLEVIVKSKPYYNAGVDNVLMSMVIFFLACSFLVSENETPYLLLSSILMIVSFWLSLRFTDTFMAMISYCCFFIFLFLWYTKAGNFAITTAPLLLMAVSAFFYRVITKLETKTFIYRDCSRWVTLLALVTFYAAGNYFVVRELNLEILTRGLTYGWIFWLFTVLIPPAYIIYGIIKRDLMVIRTGLVLIAATIFTIKYYYNILPGEIEMVIAGPVLIAVSYWLMQYLKKPAFGFTSLDLNPSTKGFLNVEALLIAETFNKQPHTENPGLYGGGDGGGGGAGSQF